MRKSPHRIRRILLYGLGALLAACLLASGLSILVNRRLPSHSEVVDRLASVEKARLAEYAHLKQALGSTVWPGWGEADIPVIVYNEQYAFLAGYPDPPPGWLKMPGREPRGTAWEAVPGDTFYSLPYYRQRLTDPKKTPEGFTVLVGDRWVATFQTKEYAEISFYSGLREEFPPVVREVVPYPLLWNLMAGESEAYVTILLHETFHAYQGMVNPQRFAEAEEALRLENQYPWQDLAQRDAWQKELDLLVDAATADSNAQAAELARQFLAQRDARRTQSGLSPELVDLEHQREWLEGLAKYAELAMGRAAASTPGYEPFPDLNDDPEFNGYRTRERFWSLQLDQVRHILSNEATTWFYYSGFAQAVLLDRLLPGWKQSALSGGKPLEDLLRDATSQ